MMIQGHWCQSVEDYLRKLGYEIYPLGVKGLRSWQLVNVLLREAAVGISPDEMPLIYQGTIPCLLDTYAGRCCGTGVIICFPRRNGELAFADFTMYHDLIKTLKNICEQILGIRPTVAGWKEAIIHPAVSPIHEATIAIPTVNGKLMYGFKDEGNIFHATISIPKGMTVHFISPDGYASNNGHEMSLKSGTHELVFHKQSP